MEIKDTPDHPALDPKEIDQMQDELIALMAAWADRGFSPTESAMFLASIAHMLLAKAGFSLAEFKEMIGRQWEAHDGEP